MPTLGKLAEVLVAIFAHILCMHSTAGMYTS